jgi:hypothetical protein
MKYKKGDTPAPGIKIIGVINGDGKDSFHHYVYKRTDTNETFESKVEKKQVFVLGPGGPIIHDDSKAEGKRAIDVVEVRIVGDPNAARIYFHQKGYIDPESGIEKDRVMKPDEFEAFLADYREMIAGKPIADESAPEEPKKSLEQINKEAEIEVANELAEAGSGTALSSIEDLAPEIVALLSKNGVTIAEQAKALGVDGLVQFKGIGKTRAEQILEAIA